MKFFTIFFAVFLALASNMTCAKESYVMVVTFPAGNQSDIAARTIADNYEKITGKKIIIENVPGGDTIVGVNRFVNSQRDILLGSGASLIFNPLLRKDITYTDKDYEHAVFLGTGVVVWVTTYNSDLHKPQDLLTRMPVLVGGYVSSFNYNLRSFVKEKAIKSEIVNYKGANQMLIDIASGEIKLGISSVNSTLIQMVKAKKIRIIGSAYHSDIDIDGLSIPSVSRAIGIPQYNGYQTLSLRPTLPAQEKAQLRNDLWKAVQMSRSTLQNLYIMDDGTDDAVVINRILDGVKLHVKRQTD